MNLKNKVAKLRTRIKPSIPQRALIVMPEPGESDEAATDRFLEQRPDMVNAPRIILELIGMTCPPKTDPHVKL
jgi:hypothetical protein